MFLVTNENMGLCLYIKHTLKNLNGKNLGIDISVFGVQVGKMAILYLSAPAVGCSSRSKNCFVLGRLVWIGFLFAILLNVFLCLGLNRLFISNY